MKKLALLSVTDKSGIADFAKARVARGFTILSTQADDHGHPD
jgi:AICAR transformylase/IMP cyclohydrolase PurH